MRVAIVSPYSWTYPGGVNRHVEDLTCALMAQGHDVRVLTPWDPDDAVTTRLHRGRRAARIERPPWLVPLGRSVAIPMNGALSNISTWYTQALRLRTELRAGEFDVVHVHEPIAPVVSWDAVAFSRAPTVATFHTHSTSTVGHKIGAVLGVRRQINKLKGRIAVSEAAGWTAERYFGGQYRVIPNGVDVDAAIPGDKKPADHLRVLFVGRPEERKGLPVLLRAFEGLRAVVPARLEIVGASRDEVEPLLDGLALSVEGIEISGRVSSGEIWQRLHEADVLCAPSLGGESFGMVLVEAFAAGTPVVCSGIAGYVDVATNGVDSLVVAPGDAQSLAEALQTLWHDPERRGRMGEAGRQKAERYAWRNVATEVAGVYEEAQSVPRPANVAARAARFAGLRPAVETQAVRPRKLPPPAAMPNPQAVTRSRAATWTRRLGLPLVMMIGLIGVGLAVERIGIDNILAAFLRSSPAYVLIGLALMSVAPLLRALSWQAILKTAWRGRVRLRDAVRGTLIGILMSATLPARLGEPSRALVMARRLGSPRESLPLVAGSIVSQFLLNVLAMVILGIAMFFSVGLFAGKEGVLVGLAAAPALIVVAVAVVPVLLRSGAARADHAAGRTVAVVRRELVRVRSGLRIFTKPRLGAWATFAQLAAWAVQWLACYALLAALHLDGIAGLGAAAAVLFAVNVTAVVPITPSNLGVFQAAVVSVLVGAYDVPWAAALAYGIVLQAVELASAVVMGLPALIAEGVSWQDIRRRALAVAPVELPHRERVAEPAASEVSSGS